MGEGPHDCHVQEWERDKFNGEKRSVVLFGLPTVGSDTLVSRSHQRTTLRGAAVLTRSSKDAYGCYSGSY